jgi:hydrogenase nickel incorporation protein HypA/HybF
MHEFSVSAEIVKNVLDTTERNNGRRVLSIQLEIGELTLLNVEQVTFWIHELFKGSMAEGAKVKVKTVKARINCGTCGYHGGRAFNQKNNSYHLISYSCPKCGSLEIKIEKGKECILRRIEAVR